MTEKPYVLAYDAAEMPERRTLTPRTEPMPDPVPEFIKAKVVERINAEVLAGWRKNGEIRSGKPDVQWANTTYEWTIARLLWERGEPEPVDPDMLIAREVGEKFNNTPTICTAEQVALAAIRLYKERNGL